jgi:hypothetical protein
MCQIQTTFVNLIFLTIAATLSLLRGVLFGFLVRFHVSKSAVMVAVVSSMEEEVFGVFVVQIAAAEASMLLNSDLYHLKAGLGGGEEVRSVGRVKIAPTEVVVVCNGDLNCEVSAGVLKVAVVDIKGTSFRIVSTILDFGAGKRSRVALGMGLGFLLLIVAIGVCLHFLNSFSPVTIGIIGVITIGGLVFVTVAGRLVNQNPVGFVDLQI